MRCLLIICLFVLAGHRVESAPRKSELSSSKGCEPGTSWKDQCNSCSCNRNGIAVCTLMLCLGSEGAPKMTEAPSGKECLPGSSWRSQCNDCTCDSNGIAVCTLESCLGHEQEPMKTCAPRTSWKKDCNACWCTSNGQAVCTLRGCFDFHDEEKISGTEPITKHVKRSSKNVTKSVVCVANRMFIKDCNTCWCNDDGTSFYCTRRICVPMSPEEVETEDPTDENTPLSRKVRALPQTDVPKACEPGQEFRMDCNKCLCDNEGKNFSCTRIDCSALNNNHNTRRRREVTKQETKKCVPGTVFNQGCNVCRCTDEGYHATCTLKRCHQENDVDVQAPEQDPGFRCNAGEQFTRDCNDCTCSADGKSVFCTLRLCDQHLTPDI